MQDTWIPIVVGLAGAALGAVCTWLLCRGREAVAHARGSGEAQSEIAVLKERVSRIQELETRLAELSGLVETARRDSETLTLEKTRLESALENERKNAAERIQTLDEAREKLTASFEVLANRIFEEKSAKFTEQNRERLGELLGPLGEKIKDFEKTVRDSYEKEGRERFSLRRQIEQLHDLNKKLDQEAVNLTKALKGQTKAQGNWGELVLERVLEKSGLVRGREFDVQSSQRAEDGTRVQPDVIVRLPEDKHLVIDAKVSLVAYERYCSAENEETRTVALKEHVDSIRKHVRELSEKRYHALPAIQSPDFVLLFVPIEPSFAVAVQEDADLFTDAFRQNIVIVSPSTLWATLRTIANIWRFEEQNRNTREIAVQAGRMLDRFTDFVGDLNRIGESLTRAQTSFDTARRRLESGKGNLIGRALKIQALGVRGSKQLPGPAPEAGEDDEESAPGS